MVFVKEVKINTNPAAEASLPLLSVFRFLYLPQPAAPTVFFPCQGLLCFSFSWPWLHKLLLPAPSFRLSVFITLWNWNQDFLFPAWAGVKILVGVKLVVFLGVSVSVTSTQMFHRSRTLISSFWAQTQSLQGGLRPQTLRWSVWDPRQMFFRALKQSYCPLNRRKDLQQQTHFCLIHTDIAKNLN